MKFKRLLTDDEAVSPVIGVILMVAITVILAAVIGTFVLNLGDDVQANPTAGVSVDGSDVTVTSLGPSTEGVYCDGDSTYTSGSPAVVGDEMNCDPDDNIIGVHENGNEAVVREL
jgi:flagellin-like protein